MICFCLLGLSIFKECLVIAYLICFQERVKQRSLKHHPRFWFYRKFCQFTHRFQFVICFSAPNGKPAKKKKEKKEKKRRRNRKFTVVILAKMPKKPND
jgi:hypothetical protein